MIYNRHINAIGDGYLLESFIWARAIEAKNCLINIQAVCLICPSWAGDLNITGRNILCKHPRRYTRWQQYRA